MNAGVLNLNTAAGTSSLTLNVAGGASAYFNLPTSSNLVLSGLNVADGGLAAMAQNLVHPSVLTVSSLNLHSSGTLDLGNNALAINYTGSGSPISAIRDLILNGQIVSSTVNNDTTGRLAIGYAEAGDIFNGGEAWPNYMSVPVIIGSTQMVLVMPTLVGDLSLEGTVTRDDFFTVLSNYGLTPGNGRGVPITWDTGDFFGENEITRDDYFTTLSNYGRSMESLGYWPAPAGGSLGLGSPVTVVPEPTTLALLALGGVAGLAGGAIRRRRRSSKAAA